MHSNSNHTWIQTYANKCHSCSSLWISAKTNLFCLCMVAPGSLLHTRLLIKPSLTLHTAFTGPQLSFTLEHNLQSSSCNPTLHTDVDNLTTVLRLKRNKSWRMNGSAIVGHFPGTKKVSRCGFTCTGNVNTISMLCTYCPRYIRQADHEFGKIPSLHALWPMWRRDHAIMKYHQLRLPTQHSVFTFLSSSFGAFSTHFEVLEFLVQLRIYVQSLFVHSVQRSQAVEIF